MGILVAVRREMARHIVVPTFWIRTDTRVQLIARCVTTQVLLAIAHHGKDLW
jgi:hypothetical protein